MPRDVPRRRFLAGTVAAALTAVAGCSGTTPFVGKRTESTETVPVRGATALTVQNQTGDVVVRGADREDIRVHAVKQASSVRTNVADLALETVREDGRIRLSSRWNGDTGPFASRPSMNLDAEVPASLAVETVQTDVGDIEVTDLAGDLQARTDTGDVRIRRVEGTVSAESDTGDVDVRTPAALDGATADTGDVSVDIPAIDGETTVQTDTGDVVARVGPDLDATLVAQSSNGNVELTGVSLSNGETTGDVTDEVVRGELGDGGPTLRVASETGDVTVQSL
ncbi:DUF4097 family beta strand repeat-containing protein [Halomicroarcula sp. GCM10025709]|uniref:DUF4097 family beta strand repeat-containing protein n=1 Tax=Haloarcula TaxID=2237 RepID=UPI0024C2E825|nr:DUF4097 family beta strand repeat-containing protein [Halomicroarcula sp. YJ-61-S]